MMSFRGPIPVQIHPAFWLTIVLLGWIWTSNLILTVIFVFVAFFSILLHEFGHGLTARFFGQRAAISLVAFGGITERSGPKLKYWQDFLIVLNGPLASSAIAIFSYWMLAVPAVASIEILRLIFLVAFQTNMYWTIFNLFPVYPLDGGSLVRIILEKLLGIKGVKISLWISLFIAAAGAIFFLFNGNMLVASLLVMSAYESYRQWQAVRYMTEFDTKDSVQLKFDEGRKLLRNKDPEGAGRLFSEIVQETKRGTLYESSLLHLAEIAASNNQISEAISLLKPVEKKLPPEGLELLQRLYYMSVNYRKSIETGLKAYQFYPKATIALYNSFSHAALSEARQAVGWLQAAEREGLPDTFDIRSRTEYTKIKDDPIFVDYLKTSAS